MKAEKPLVDLVRPWYREPWPWILAAGPAIVVVAGIYTAWLAIESNDGLVTEDYYRKGLAASQTVARNEVAAKMGLVAHFRLASDRMSLRLSATDPLFTTPAALSVTISHPTRAGLDQSLVLPRGAESYVGEVRLPAAGHWLVMIEDEHKTWRLFGNVILPASGEVLIGAGAADDSPVRAGIRN